MSTMADLFGPVIHAYTRAAALRDEVLVDMHPLAAEYGFRWPVAMTAAAHLDTVRWGSNVAPGKAGMQDETGRAWDVLTMARVALPAACRSAQKRGQGRVPFQVLRVPAAGRRTRPELVTLHLHVGPGDQGEPVITILLPDED